MNTKKMLHCLFFSFLLFSCNTEEKKEEVKECCKKGDMQLTDTVLSDESVFNLSSVWKTQNNHSVTLDTFKGKITVAAMVFTHCESACPRIVADVQRIEKAFTPEELKQISFLLISMDPIRDTPERCTEFAKEHQLNDNWTLISSGEDATIEIANVLNVRVKKLASGGFDHSNTIHILNQLGEISYQQNGLAQEPDEAIQKIKVLLTE